MIVINLSRKQVSAQDEDVGIAHIWTPQEFLAEFTVPDVTGYHSAMYQEERGIYQVTDRTTFEVTEYTDPQQEPFLAWLADNKDLIMRQAEYHQLMREREYPNDDYVWNGGTGQWDLVPAPDRLNEDAKIWVQRHEVEIAIALSYLWEAAESKNVFDGVTIPAAVTQTITTIINNRSLLE